MEGATTRIKNPKAGNATDAIKSFNFDYSYWSKEVREGTATFASYMHFVQTQVRRGAPYIIATCIFVHI